MAETQSSSTDVLRQSLDNSGTAIGTLCGNTSAESLAATAIPAATLTQCTDYTSANSMLDLIVGGCKYINIITVINATQPDQGDGHVYHFSADQSHQVNSCTKDAIPEPLANCLASAAYSTYFRFSTDRVIAKSASAADFIFYDAFE